MDNYVSMLFMLVMLEIPLTAVLVVLPAVWSLEKEILELKKEVRSHADSNKQD